MPTGCEINGCGRRITAQKMCSAHNKRRRLGKDIYAPHRYDIPWKDRFWAKVNQTPTCWLWTGAKTVDGYGEFMHQYKVRRAHRVTYEWARGSIPKGLQLDHLCRVRHCVNPDHLEAVTQQENIRRGLKGILRNIEVSP